MLRLRLASLALASGLLFTLSGCTSTCEDSRLFPRLFRSSSMSQSAIQGMPGECDCQQGVHGAHQLPPMMDSASMPGPMWSSQTGPNAVPIPITNIPANQPPQIFKIPQAQPTPFSPAH